MKAGEPYEKAAEVVFRELFKALPELDVRQDVSVQGLTTMHQVDVLVGFKGGPLQYQTVVQAKDWAKPVDQGEVLKLRAVLDDLPGQPKGILVSRAGFQAGAIQMAKARGIGLYELRAPKAGEVPQDEWRWHLTAYRRRLENLTVDVDEQWCRAEAARFGLAGRVSLKGPLGTPREILLSDADGVPQGSLGDAIKQLFPTSPGPLSRSSRTVVFDPPLFVPTEPGSPLDRLRVKGIAAEVWTEELSLEAQLTFEYVVVWVLRAVEDGKPMAFDDQGKLIEPGLLGPVTQVQWMLDPALEAT